MKALTLALLLSLPAINLQPAQPPRQPASHLADRSKGGRWYFAENGHAVYCLGPVRLLPQAEGGLQRVATFCQGDKNMVPLKD